ncbi:MAG: T9SS type A sorting domain-containing protein [Candidatus Zixiibacteriota bacterium]|nr:MAG: T9SS type A sorting domain-containing protein [candidate division Zixibacteria bacterium]
MKLINLTLLILGVLLASGASAQSPDSFIVEDGYALPGDTVAVSIYMRNTQFSVAAFTMRFVLIDSALTNFAWISRGSAVINFEHFNAQMFDGTCRIVGIADLPYNGGTTPPLPVGYHEMVRVGVAISELAPLGGSDSIVFMSDSLPPDRDNSISDSTGYINEVPTLINGIIAFNTQSGIGDHPLGLPLKAQLFQNYPNPFNAETRISFTLTDEVGDIKLDIFDLMGREVKNYFWNGLMPGEHRVIWDGKNKNGQSLASGIYFYRLVLSGSTVDHKSMTLLK